jgi:hypothetical protein
MSPLWIRGSGPIMDKGVSSNTGRQWRVIRAPVDHPLPRVTKLPLTTYTLTGKAVGGAIEDGNCLDIFVCDAVASAHGAASGRRRWACGPLHAPGRGPASGDGEPAHQLCAEHPAGCGEYYHRLTFTSLAKPLMKLRQWETEYNQDAHLALNGATQAEWLRDLWIMCARTVRRLT